MSTFGDKPHKRAPTCMSGGGQAQWAQRQQLALHGKLLSVEHTRWSINHLLRVAAVGFAGRFAGCRRGAAILHNALHLEVLRVRVLQHCALSPLHLKHATASASA